MPKPPFTWNPRVPLDKVAKAKAPWVQPRPDGAYAFGPLDPRVPASECGHEVVQDLMGPMSGQRCLGCGCRVEFNRDGRRLAKERDEIADDALSLARQAHNRAHFAAPGDIA